MRKSERALESARIDLRYGDPDGAVNRAYYAMFNAARASLLSAGVSEGNLPRTHNGVIAAFGHRAVQTGRVDATLGRLFNEAEGLRLKADYTGSEIGTKAAEELVASAEVFVRTVGREFGLEIPTKELTVGKHTPSIESQDKDLVATHSGGESAELPRHASSAEDTRRQAREDWLKNYYYKSDSADEAGLQQMDEQKEAGKAQPEKDVGFERDAD